MKTQNLSSRAVLWRQVLGLFFVLLSFSVAVYTLVLGHSAFAIFIFIIGVVLVIVEKKENPYVTLSGKRLVIRHLIFCKTTYDLDQVVCLREKRNAFELLMKNGEVIPLYDSVFSTSIFKNNFPKRKKKLRSILPVEIRGCED